MIGWSIAESHDILVNWHLNEQVSYHSPDAKPDLWMALIAVVNYKYIRLVLADAWAV